MSFSETDNSLTKNARPDTPDTVTALDVPFVDNLRSYLAFDPIRFPILQLRRGHHARFYKFRVRSNLVNVPARAYISGDMT